MQTTNIAIGNGATIEYQPDGTLIVRPNGVTQPNNWQRESDDAPLKVLLTALRGGKVMKHVMGKVLLSAGRGQ